MQVHVPVYSVTSPAVFIIEEVKSLLDNGVSSESQSMKAIGYKEVISYFNNEFSYEEMIEKLKQNSRHYAKRQLTWFRKNKEVVWLDGLEKQQNNIKIILEECSGKEKQEGSKKEQI